MNSEPHSDVRDSPILQKLLGNQSAFRAFLRRRVRDHAIADDVLQQSFVRAVANQHTVANSESAVAWFYAILRNTLTDYVRSSHTRERTAEDYHQHLILSGEDLEVPVDELQAEACQCVYRLLPGIRHNYAELIRRVDLEGEPPEKISEELGITVKNLAVRLHRARKSLRMTIEQSCGVCSKHGCISCTCNNP